MTVHFKQNLLFGMVDINWAEAGHINLNIVLQIEGIKHDLTLQGLRPYTEVNRLNNLIKELKILSKNIGTDYSIQIKDDGTFIDFSWDEAHEEESWKSLREELWNFGHLFYGIALASLELGHKLKGDNLLKSSVTIFQYGIDVLDDKYANPRLVDDTPTKLGLAQYNFASGKLLEASTLFERVLESRVHEYNILYAPFR